MQINIIVYNDTWKIRNLYIASFIYNLFLEILVSTYYSSNAKVTAKNMDELVALCKRRGFIFQSNEIYGGIQGVYDFGPLGVELKNNLKDSWWSSVVYDRDDVEGIDASILTHPEVLKYSGHEDTFTDPLVDCKSCGERFRADQIPSYCKDEDLTEPRQFNLMFNCLLYTSPSPRDS